MITNGSDWSFRALIIVVRVLIVTKNVIGP